MPRRHLSELETGHLPCEELPWNVEDSVLVADESHTQTLDPGREEVQVSLAEERDKRPVVHVDVEIDASHEKVAALYCSAHSYGLFFRLAVATLRLCQGAAGKGYGAQLSCSLLLEENASQAVRACVRRNRREVRRVIACNARVRAEQDLQLREGTLLSQASHPCTVFLEESTDQCRDI